MNTADEMMVDLEKNTASGRVWSFDLDIDEHFLVYFLDLKCKKKKRKKFETMVVENNILGLYEAFSCL